MRPGIRRPITAGLLIGLLAATAASAQVQSKAQRRCITALNQAGARLAAATAKNFTDCVSDAVNGRLPAGQTASQCLAGDRRGRIAAAKGKTTRIAGKRCGVAPGFGPTSADVVNAAFGDLLRVASVFGPDVDATLQPASGARAAAVCQLCVARGMARVANARVKEFNACASAGLRRGAIRSALALGGCLDSDTKKRVARAIAKAAQAARKKCSTTALATAFPGECAASGLGGLFDCVGGRVNCGVCLAYGSADGLGKQCHQYTDGVATLYCGTRPVNTQSVARQWNEETLSAIRRDNPRPPVHARNLFHVAVAMYDAWAAYDATAKTYLTNERTTSSDVETDRATAISFAAYRVLTERYAAALAIGAADSLLSFDARLEGLGYDKRYVSTTDPTPAALGNRIAAAIIELGKDDGSLESENYADPTYAAVNQPLVVKVPDIDFATVADINHWQPLALDVMIGQNGVRLPGKIQPFVGAQWGGVTPFALTHVTPNDLYLDPGPQPRLGGAGDAEFKTQVQEVIDRASQLTPDDGATMDISPAVFGNNDVGTNDGHGYGTNPVTGQPYPSHVVKRGDFGRVIAEYWADGPTSETPPGHWNVLANQVADAPGFQKRFMGTGPVLSDLEWDVKTYFAVNAATSDAAIACWGAKRVYDSVRPITMIRWMGKKGQSKNPGGPSYDPLGLPLETNVIEVITSQSSAPGERHAALVSPDIGGKVGDIAILSWPGGPSDAKTQHSGVKWILAKGWNPYQRNTFVTPAFPGYFSGHSTFSRAAAEVLAAITGSPYFPGGHAEFVAHRNAFLQFEQGPSDDVRLEWATYYDAADQAGQSRLWGGIHVQADDFNGRTRGQLIGLAVFAKAKTYFDGTAN